jgi:DNA-binding beta-propeller fold protein YncE
MKLLGLFICVLLILFLGFFVSETVIAQRRKPDTGPLIQLEKKKTLTPEPDSSKNSSQDQPAPGIGFNLEKTEVVAPERSNPYRYLGTLVPSGTLANAYGVTRDQNGKIFVTNGTKNKIGIFDVQAFQSLGTLKSAPAPKLKLPYGIGSDGDNNLYVADFNNNVVKKFIYNSATNSYTRTQWTNFNGPTSVWVDTWGNAWSNRVYVADTYNHQIRIFRLDGAPAAKSTLKKNFSYPFGVTVGPSGRIFVADSGNDVIKVFNSNLKLTKTWSGFNEPRQLAVDANENIYVADMLNNRIKILKSDGSVLTTINKYPGGPKFKLPEGVAVTPDGNTLYIADSGNNRVSVWVKPAVITVTKIVSPSTDTGKFNLCIDGTICSTDVGNGGMVSANTLMPGPHTITETAVTGTSMSDYVATFSGDCASDGTVTVGAGDSKTCTITNTRTTTFTVEKDFSDNDTATVTVQLTCTSGSIAANDLPASEASPAVFTVNGFSSGTTCTATESNVPDGYTQDESACVDVGLPSPGECKIVNTASP